MEKDFVAGLKTREDFGLAAGGVAGSMVVSRVLPASTRSPGLSGTRCISPPTGAAPTKRLRMRFSPEPVRLLAQGASPSVFAGDELAMGCGGRVDEPCDGRKRAVGRWRDRWSSRWRTIAKQGWTTTPGGERIRISSFCSAVFKNPVNFLPSDLCGFNRTSYRVKTRV